MKTNRVVLLLPLPLPSCLDTSLTVIRGSLSRMVPTPWASAMPALVAPLRLTTKVSVDSDTRSPSTATVIVLLVWPAAKVTSPEPAV